MNETPSKSGTRLGRAIAYALIYVIGLLALHGAGLLLAGIAAVLGLTIDPLGGMLLAAILFAVAYRQAGEGAQQHG